MSKMVCSRGRVLSAGEGPWARVEVTRSVMCDNCSQAGACISGPEAGKETVASVYNPVGAKEGDTVEISLNEGVILWGTVVLYLMPVLFLLAFILAGFYLKGYYSWDVGENLLAASAGVLGLLAAIPAVRIISTRSRYLAHRGRPEITRILEPG
ncbi:MAG: SoxR reducing system RseC family protein [Gemmatimonadota bacterium]|nr:SoxR reducing system RseC family protein [Gemmatimonadota bacterium]